MNQNQQIQTPEQAAKILRLIWGMMLLGQLAFFAVALVVSFNGEPATFESVKIFYIIAVVLGLMSVPMGSFIRMQIYKKHWVNNAVTPQGYFIGSLLSMAIIEGAALFSIVVLFLHGQIGPTLALPIALMGVFAMNYPNGKPMQPSNPDFINNQPPDLLKK
ncbi:MAG: hypothetical protein CMJ19_11535 [Phycisphaeraceae bacterium]|nr:hypothetical protein [Phycisphaeraceae bacterium]|tara:strand:- start:239 stop:721 length:483 start_codon:yes stop_codon:yes gene_type:complete